MRPMSISRRRRFLASSSDKPLVLLGTTEPFSTKRMIHRCWSGGTIPARVRLRPCADKRSCRLGEFPYYTQPPPYLANEDPEGVYLSEYKSEMDAVRKAAT